MSTPSGALTGRWLSEYDWVGTHSALLPRVWCEMASEKFSVLVPPSCGMDIPETYGRNSGLDGRHIRFQACTLLDATPVRHLDWQTAKITPDFWEAERKVKEKPRPQSVK